CISTHGDSEIYLNQRFSSRDISLRMETPLDVLSRAASLVHADDEKREAALRGESRMQPVSSPVNNHRTAPPPISPSKRKHSIDLNDDSMDPNNEHMAKMSRLFATHLGKPTNGDYRREPRDRSRSPIERLHPAHLYTHMPNLAMEQPLALTKNSPKVPNSPSASPIERQQNRPSVITCAPANNRNCNLSHCTVSHNGCSPSNYRRPSN
ncbi:transcription cofactor vestigial-like protein 4 isoform X2, partial [Clarias magur]